MYFAKNEIILEPYEDIAIKKENDSQYTKMATSYKGENLYINEEPVFLLRKSYKEPDMPEFANIETRKVSVQEELNPVLIKLEQLLLKQKLYSAKETSWRLGRKQNTADFGFMAILAIKR